MFLLGINPHCSLSIMPSSPNLYLMAQIRAKLSASLLKKLIGLQLQCFVHLFWFWDQFNQVLFEEAIERKEFPLMPNMAKEMGLILH